MKRLLQLSLVLNLVLLGIAVGRSRHAPPPPTSSETTVDSPEPADPAVSVTTSPWKQIETRDASQFIANLRAVGCSEQTIRDIMLYRVCREFYPRFVELEAAAARTNGWTREPDWHAARQHARQQAELREEMINTVETLLGQSWNSLLSAKSLDWLHLGDPLEPFSEDQRRAIGAVERRYGLLAGDVNYGGIAARGYDSEDLANRRRLNAEKNAALAAILSPAEVKEYQYRNRISGTASDFVRQELPEPKSEAEYRAMVDEALKFEVLVDPLPRDKFGNPLNGQAEIDAHRAAFNQRLRELLGEDRFLRGATGQ